ncbi:unnamed protein product [Orchesella dallaii]|uniref:Uncharacterized protein n=1 Tax=Orchesella dallaii TaxID=48710 RepID=A0ABP1QZQ3_9HEXA
MVKSTSPSIASCGIKQVNPIRQVSSERKVISKPDEIDITQEEVCRRKATVPMNLGKVFPNQDKAKGEEKTNAEEGPSTRGTNKSSLKEPKDGKIGQNQAESTMKEAVDLELDLFISDTEEISEDNTVLSRVELQETLARTQKKLLRLSALKPLKKPIE